MRASVSGRQELAARVQQALGLQTKKQAEMVADAVVAALEATLLNNLRTDGALFVALQPEKREHFGGTEPTVYQPKTAPRPLYIPRYQD